MTIEYGRSMSFLIGFTLLKWSLFNVLAMILMKSISLKFQMNSEDNIYVYTMFSFKLFQHAEIPCTSVVV